MLKKTLELEEVKKIQFNILKYIKNVCKENNIRYFLCGGTLLGAIRHKGFIPWDDDIDLLIPRHDYMKLLKILEDSDRYRCISLYSNSDYYYSFAKVIDINTTLIETELSQSINGYGVYIDIFPIDGLPKDDVKTKIHFEKVLRVRNLLYMSVIKNCPPSSSKWKLIMKYLLWIFSKLIGWKRWIKIIEKLATKYDFNNGDKVACIVAGYGTKEIVDKDIFNKSIEMEFEGEKFSAPIGYDEYLTNLYGDYMQLPPIEKRISHHKFEAYYK